MMSQPIFNQPFFVETMKTAGKVLHVPSLLHGRRAANGARRPLRADKRSSSAAKSNGKCPSVHASSQSETCEATLFSLLAPFLI